jgi:hypothetical protein
MMQNTVIDHEFASIVDAVSFWLGYQFKIGRKQLIHEASLRYPIADSITAKGISINRVVLEMLHPIFKSKKIDLVIYSKNIRELEDEKDDEYIQKVYEFKLVKKNTGDYNSIEHQRVFDDVVRLAYYNLWKKKECYFVMCGKYEDFIAYFIGQKSDVKVQDGKNIVSAKFNKKDKYEWISNGLYKDWFGFNIGEEVKKEFISDDEEWGLKIFQENYKIRDEIQQKFCNSIKIQTTCMAITPQGLEKSRTHAAGIWKIESY